MPLALTTNHRVFPWDVGKCVCEGGVWEGQDPLVSPLIPQGPQVYTFSIREEIKETSAQAAVGRACRGSSYTPSAHPAGGRFSPSLATAQPMRDCHRPANGKLLHYELPVSSAGLLVYNGSSYRFFLP